MSTSGQMDRTVDLSKEVLERCAAYLRSDVGETRRGLLLLSRLLEQDENGLVEQLGENPALESDVFTSLRNISREGDARESEKADELRARLGVEDVFSGTDSVGGVAESGGEEVEERGLLDLPVAGDGECKDEDFISLLEEARGNSKLGSESDSVETAHSELEYLQRFQLFEERADDLPLEGVVGVIGGEERARRALLFQLAYRRLLELNPVLVLSISPDDASVERTMRGFPRIDRLRDRGVLRIEHLSPKLVDDTEGALRYLEDCVQDFVSRAEGSPQVFIHPLSMLHVLFDRASATRLIYRLRPKVEGRGSLYVACDEGDSTNLNNLLDTVLELESGRSSDFVECLVENPPGKMRDSYGFEFDGDLLLPSTGRPQEHRYVRCGLCGEEVLKKRSRSVDGEDLCSECAGAGVEAEQSGKRRVRKRQRLI